MSDVSYINKPNRLLRVYALLFLLVLYLPILSIPVFSFNDSIYVRFPLEGFTTQWFVQLWERDSLWGALQHSLQVAIACAIISTTFGVLAARAIANTMLPGQSAIVAFIMLPLVIPGIIFGVALLVLLSRIGITLSLYTVTLGHLIVCLPFAVATLLPRFEGFDRSMEEASVDLGENSWWTFWRVTLPIVAPGIVASLLLTFTISFDEFIMAFFLSGQDATLPMYIWSQLRFPREFPAVLALSTIILLVSFALVFSALWIGKLGLQKDDAASRLGV
ncbi:MAG: ABC transporter permease [Pseudomonadota bacterium]